jgi:hypothetical protein
MRPLKKAKVETQLRAARQFRSRLGLRRQSAATTALSPVRAIRELLRTVARAKAAWRASRRPPLLDQRPDRGCVADQPQPLRRSDRHANTQHALRTQRAAADPAPSGTQPRSMTPSAMTTRRRCSPWPGRFGARPGKAGGRRKKLALTRVDDEGFCWGFRRFWRANLRAFGAWRGSGSGGGGTQAGTVAAGRAKLERKNFGFIRFDWVG